MITDRQSPHLPPRSPTPEPLVLLGDVHLSGPLSAEGGAHAPVARLQAAAGRRGQVLVGLGARADVADVEAHAGVGRAPVSIQ